MKRHVPWIVAAVLVVAVVVAAVAFAASAGRRGSVVGARAGTGLSADATRTTSTESTSFSFLDTQAALVQPSIAPPKRVYDRPQRNPGTAARLAEHGRAFDPQPPDYLLAQGLTRVKDAGKRVVLTFDDGPSPNTTKIVSILDRYDVHATFFFIGGRAENDRTVLMDVLKQGSEIGNHTWQHTDLWHATMKWDEEQILKAQDIFQGLVGVKPVYVRPKGGQIDQTGMDAIKALDKMYVYWDVSGYDTVPEFTPKDIRDSVLEDVRPGSIILLHETNPKTVEALPSIIEGLKRRGYRVESLTQVLAR